MLPAVAAEARLIFVTAKGRSGVTLVGRLLDRHPDVALLQELHFFERLWSPGDGRQALERSAAVELAATLLALQRAGALFFPSALGPFIGEAAAIVDALPLAARTAPGAFAAVLQYEARRMGRRIPCEQTPRNVLFIREILETFPEARVVVVVRDPRGVLAAQKHAWRVAELGGRPMPRAERRRLRVTYHPAAVSLVWRASVRAGDRFAGHARVCSVRFEDLLEHPAHEVERLCRFLGVAYDERMLHVAHIDDRYRASGRTGIEAGEAGAWRSSLSHEEIWLCERLCAAEMVRHGYTRTGVRPRLGALLVLAALFPVQALATLAVNRDRYASLPRAVGRRLRNVWGAG
jgi:hypothetical protein